jgi:hypothetical protein
MQLFRVAVVVVGAAGALAEVAVEVVIAGLAAAEVRFDIPVADGPAAQDQAALRPEGPAAQPPEGQALLGGDPRTTVRYATVPRPGPLCLAVMAKLVVK